MREAIGSDDMGVSWIRSNFLAFWTRDPLFIRALTKAVLDQSYGNQTEPARYKLLSKFTSGENKENARVEMLRALDQWFLDIDGLDNKRFIELVDRLLNKEYIIDSSNLQQWAKDLRNTNYEIGDRILDVVRSVLSDAVKVNNMLYF